MYKRWCTILALAICLTIPATLSAFALKDTWHRSFDVAQGVEFVLGNVNGGIEIEGWERDEIEVHADIKVKAPSKSKAKKLLKELKFKIEADRDRVRISTDRPRIRQDGLFGALFGGRSTITIRYTVKVPRRVSLEVENTNGDIDAQDFEGRFRLHTVNGEITIYSLKGQGKAKTVNGAIECSIESFPRGGDLELKTVNGGIDLRFPEGAGTTLEAKAVNGGIDLDIDLTKRIRIKRSSIRGVIGDGDGSVYLKTVNGGISIEPY